MSKPLGQIPGSLSSKSINFSQNEGTFLDTAFGFTKNYFRVEGKIPSPVAAPTAELQFVQWSAPYGMLVIQWIAERVGSLPDLPDPDTQNANEVFLGQQITPAVPVRTAMGVVYTVSGVYNYGLKVPPDRNYSIGKQPQSKNATAKITPGNFIKGVFG